MGCFEVKIVGARNVLGEDNLVIDSQVHDGLGGCEMLDDKCPKEGGLELKGDILADIGYAWYGF